MDTLPQIGYSLTILIMMTGLYLALSENNLVKQLIGINVFQVGVFCLIILLGFIPEGEPPIYTETNSLYSAPLPNVLILTAIVVSIAIISVGIALLMRINKSFGTVEEDKLLNQ